MKGIKRLNIWVYFVHFKFVNLIWILVLFTLIFIGFISLHLSFCFRVIFYGQDLSFDAWNYFKLLRYPYFLKQTRISCHLKKQHYQDEFRKSCSCQLTNSLKSKWSLKVEDFWNHKRAARKKWFTLRVAEEYCYRLHKKFRGGQVYAAHVLLALNWWDRFHSCPQSRSYSDPW